MEATETPLTEKAPCGEITDADYKKAEIDLLRDAMKRSYKERFLMMTKLMKMNLMFKRAKIIHKPFLNKA